MSAAAEKFKEFCRGVHWTPEKTRSIIIKKKIIISICLVFCLIGFLIWWNIPAKKIDVDYNNIEKIIVTDLTTGEEFYFADKHEKMSIVIPYQDEYINFKKVGFSFDDSDLGYQVKIKLKDETIGSLNGWNEFIINSDDRIKKGKFYYKQFNADFSCYMDLRMIIENQK